MKFLAHLLLALLLPALMPVFAAQAPKDTAEVHLAAFRVVTQFTPNGVRETLEPLQTLRPGDTVEYVATYRNGTDRPARDVQVSVPVPNGGLEYVGATASAARPSTASVDGKTFATLPLQREVQAAGGVRVRQDVPLSEYRVLRWSLGDLPAGASRSVRARMHLPGVAQATAAAR